MTRVSSFCHIASTPRGSLGFVMIICTVIIYNGANNHGEPKAINGMKRKGKRKHTVYVKKTVWGKYMYSYYYDTKWHGVLSQLKRV